ncbi:MAG: SIS domain-containing protein [Gammaproteobacteria bacterium]|nr:SIS domain-containing protein [Gammaproteobacteria bacterium]MDH5692835.1 SIS domain-containing protein [Gammaproteobacteria bacterium]
MTIAFDQLLQEHQQCMNRVAEIKDNILSAISHLKQVLGKGGTVYVCGNGGSAADAQHFSSEFTGRFEKDRSGFRAVALTVDTSAITAIGNDYGFEKIFSRQLESLAHEGDCLVVISTSGGSKNLQAAVNSAKELGVSSIGLLGRDGGELAKIVDYPLVVSAQRTSRIQEAHIFILHALCEAFEPH